VINDDANADDRTIICLIHETGTAPGGDQFDNLAVYTFRLRPDGQADRAWTVDLDAEHCEAFWQKNPGLAQKTFLSLCGVPDSMRHSLQASMRRASGGPQRRGHGPRSDHGGSCSCREHAVDPARCAVIPTDPGTAVVVAPRFVTATAKAERPPMWPFGLVRIFSSDYRERISWLA
jgi:hypothetical protein